MWFLTLSKKIVREIVRFVNFDNVCMFQRGNVINDCCLLWKSFSIVGSMWKRHLTQLNPKHVSDEKDIV